MILELLKFALDSWGNFFGTLILMYFLHAFFALNATNLVSLIYTKQVELNKTKAGQ